MQEASVSRYRRFVLGLHSPREILLLLRRVFFLRPVSLLKSGATPLELFALLLFAFPLLFTLQKLVELLALGERSHQFIVEPREHFTAIHPHNLLYSVIFDPF